MVNKLTKTADSIKDKIIKIIGFLKIISTKSKYLLQ